MTTTQLGACEWFVWDLRRSNLMDRGQLDQVVGEFLKKEPRAEPTALAQFLVDQEILTAFQAQRLLHGKTQGLVLGPYTLMDALGTGSMGTVYKAQSKNDNHMYAVKVLPRRSMWNVRIARRQVRAFEQIKHPAVVPFVDVGTSGSTHYLAWPLVEGETLETMVQQRGKLAHDLAALYALQAAEGLDVCHQQNIIHGLLKPSNLMIGCDGQVRILDFGIGMLLANAEGESLVDTMSTANSVTSGLDCASPECIMEPSNRTPAGDQYSLGCVLYFCLTGQYPFPDGTAVDKMMAHQTKSPTPIRDLNPDVPEELTAIVDKLMQKTPEARYDSTLAVVEALRPLAATPSTLVPRIAKRVAKSAPVIVNGVKDGTVGGDVSKPVTETANHRPSAPPPTLPTRQSLRPDLVPAPVPIAAVAAPAAEASQAAAHAFFLDEPSRFRMSLETKLGPVGLVVGAMLAAAITWLASWWLFR
jgi:serine/threonine-protein kinase